MGKIRFRSGSFKKRRASASLRDVDSAFLILFTVTNTPYVNFCHAGALSKMESLADDPGTPEVPSLLTLVSFLALVVSQNSRTFTICYDLMLFCRPERATKLSANPPTMKPRHSSNCSLQIMSMPTMMMHAPNTPIHGKSSRTAMLQSSSLLLLRLKKK